MDLNELRRYWLKFTHNIDYVRDLGHQVWGNYLDFLFGFLKSPTLEDTFNEKIGGGPHGYGDPTDTSIRKEETYLFPPMIWRKVRFEKCLTVTENFYKCMGFGGDCKSEEEAMTQCRSVYYTPEKIDEVENECIQEYIKLRSKFRESGSEEDLWKMKMMILEPKYDVLRKLRQKQEAK